MSVLYMMKAMSVSNQSDSLGWSKVYAEHLRHVYERLSITNYSRTVFTCVPALLKTL